MQIFIFRTMTFLYMLARNVEQSKWPAVGSGYTLFCFHVMTKIHIAVKGCVKEFLKKE